MERSGPSLRSVCITPVSPTQALAVHTYTVDRANHWQGIGLEVGGWRGWGRSSLFCLRGCKASRHQHPRWQLLLPAQTQIFQPGFYPITVAIVWFPLLAFPSLQFLWRRFLGRVPTTHAILSWQQSELPPKPHIHSKISCGPVSP